MFTAHLPILPVPTTPAVLPTRATPIKPVILKLNSFVLLEPKWVFLFTVWSKAAACSATDSGEYAGTLNTGIPNSFVFSKSTLSKPAHLKSITLMPPSFNVCITSAFASSFTKLQVASKPFALSAVAGVNLSSK